jgi:hypothetical protein
VSSFTHTTGLPHLFPGLPPDDETRTSVLNAVCALAEGDDITDKQWEQLCNFEPDIAMWIKVNSLPELDRVEGEERMARMERVESVSPESFYSREPVVERTERVETVERVSCPKWLQPLLSALYRSTTDFLVRMYLFHTLY